MGKKWGEKEQRLPRRLEVVKNIDGSIGIVSKLSGTLLNKNLWVCNEYGEEIFSDETAENFILVDQDEAFKFQTRRFEILGYKVGNLCSYKGNLDIPLEILQMNWNFVSNRMTFCLRDFRFFDSQIMKTSDETLIPVFDLGFPPVEAIFSQNDSGLKYRLQINLIETVKDGWATCGSPWEFNTEEDALKEIEAWKSRLKIRRVASVLNADWKIEFPCWSIEAVSYPEKKFRVIQVHSFNGASGYFKTALHATLAIKMIPEDDWISALSHSQDTLFS